MARHENNPIEFGIQRFFTPLCFVLLPGVLVTGVRLVVAMDAPEPDIALRRARAARDREAYEEATGAGPAVTDLDVARLDHGVVCFCTLGWPPPWHFWMYRVSDP
ncbi:MAG: hypothetical protein U5K37_05235 [Natrialbaceae archaeon]|nr:hypothetical protein [Natrialbaceae archaeon]